MAALRRAAQHLRLAHPGVRTASRMTSRPLPEVKEPEDSLAVVTRPCSAIPVSLTSMSSQARVFCTILTKRLCPLSNEHLRRNYWTSVRNTGTNVSTSPRNARETLPTKTETHQNDSLTGRNVTTNDQTSNKNVTTNDQPGNIIDKDSPTFDGNTRRTNVPPARKSASSDNQAGRNVSLFRADSDFWDVTSASERPLVVLFPWRGSTAKLRAKYSKVYQRLGLDVLCLSQGMTVPVCSIPPLIPVVTRQVLHVLQDTNGPFTNRPLLIHCMSGGYMFAGSMLMQMDPQANTTSTSLPNNTHQNLHNHPTTVAKLPLRSPDSQTSSPNQPPTSPNMIAKDFPRADSRGVGGDDVRGRIVGMVWDCPVLTPFMARRGLDKSVFNPLLRFPLRASLSLFSPILDPMYDQYGQAMITLDSSPKLILHSLSDPYCPASLVHKVVSELKAQGVNVRVHAFREADHVRLLGKDPESYQREVLHFLQSLGLVGSSRV